MTSKTKQIIEDYEYYQNLPSYGEVIEELECTKELV